MCSRSRAEKMPLLGGSGQIDYSGVTDAENIQGSHFQQLNNCSLDERKSENKQYSYSS